LVALSAQAREKSLFHGTVPVPPPQPYDEVVDVPRGGAVWIPLNAYSLTSPIIRFRVRRGARAGKLGPPQLVDDRSGRIKYTPPEGAGPGEDSFEYAVQSNAGVSGAAEVHIKITDRDPNLMIPDELDFGQVLPGETARRDLVLQNIGGGLAEGTVELPDGWTVDGDAAYHLRGGASHTFTLVFTALEPKQYSGDIEYPGVPGHATDVKAEVVPPVTVDTGTLELTQAGNIRLAELHLASRIDTPQSLRITAGPSLDADPAVTVPPKGDANLTVRAKVSAGDGEIRDHITIESDVEKISVPVHAVAILQLAQNVPSASPTSPAGPSLSATPQPMPPAAAMNRLPVLAANQANGAQPFQAITPLPDFPSLPQDSGDVGQMQSFGTIAPLEIVTVDQNAARLICHFQGVAAGAKSFRMDLQTLELGANGRVQTKWTPFSTVSFHPGAGDDVTVEMTYLRPHTLYLVRVVAVDASGKFIAMTGTVGVWTLRMPRAAYGRWEMVALLLLAGGAGWWWWKRRRSATQ
jgi:hypothetical protein